MCPIVIPEEIVEMSNPHRFFGIQVKFKLVEIFFCASWRVFIAYCGQPQRYYGFLAYWGHTGGQLECIAVNSSSASNVLVLTILCLGSTIDNAEDAFRPKPIQQAKRGQRRRLHYFLSIIWGVLGSIFFSHLPFVLQYRCKKNCPFNSH